jgi:hypothetical protein
MIKVKNRTGTSGLTCKCKSWLTHWEKHGNSMSFFCAEKDCYSFFDLVGAHVKKTNVKDNIWYIIPLCKKHNNSTDELEIRDHIVLVPANVAETCGKNR